MRSAGVGASARVHAASGACIQLAEVGDDDYADASCVREGLCRTLVARRLHPHRPSSGPSPRATAPMPSDAVEAFKLSAVPHMILICGSS